MESDEVGWMGWGWMDGMRDTTELILLTDTTTTTELNTNTDATTTKYTDG